VNIDRISFSYPGVVLKNQGAPLEIILPKKASAGRWKRPPS